MCAVRVNVTIIPKIICLRVKLLNSVIKCIPNNIMNEIERRVFKY